MALQWRPTTDRATRLAGHWTPVHRFRSLGCWRAGGVATGALFVVLLAVATASIGTGTAAARAEVPTACHESCGDTGAPSMPSPCLHDAGCGAQLPASGSTTLILGVLGAAVVIAGAAQPSTRVAPREYAVLGRETRGRLFRPPRFT